MKGECVAKGRKAGSGGKVAQFMVATSYHKSVLTWEQLEKMKGVHFEGFIHLDCKSMSQNSINSTVFYLFKMSQKLKIANMEVAKHGIKQISIPARSPDLNPIQNSFNVVEQKLGKDAVTRNSIWATMMEYPVTEIEKIIKSMGKRITIVIKNKGRRL